MVCRHKNITGSKLSTTLLLISHSHTTGSKILQVQIKEDCVEKYDTNGAKYIILPGIVFSALFGIQVELYLTDLNN